MSAPPVVVFTREPGVIPETARLEVVAFVTVAKPVLTRVANRSDDDAIVEKKDVLVAFVKLANVLKRFVLVALVEVEVSEVRLKMVEDALERSPEPKVCSAVKAFAAYVFGIVVDASAK